MWWSKPCGSRGVRLCKAEGPSSAKALGESMLNTLSWYEEALILRVEGESERQQGADHLEPSVSM